MEFGAAIRYFAVMCYSKNMLLLSSAVRNFKITTPSYSGFFDVNQTSLSSLKTKGQEISSKFLLGNFLTMSLRGNQSDELKQFLGSINSGKSCDLFSEALTNTG